MAEELRVALVQEGAHRPRSKGTPGYERDIGHEDGTNDMRGPTESRSATLDDLADYLGYTPTPPRTEPKREQQSLVDTLQQVAEVAEWAIPLYLRYVHPFVKEKVNPFVKEQAAKLDKWHRNKVQPPGRRYLDTGPALPAEPAATPATADVAVAEPVIVLTRDQYRQQVLLTMAVDRMPAQKKAALSTAVVLDDDDLTPQLRGAINLVLEGKAYQLDAEMAAMLTAYLREARFLEAEEQMLPIEVAAARQPTPAEEDLWGANVSSGSSGEARHYQFSGRFR